MLNELIAQGYPFQDFRKAPSWGVHRITQNVSGKVNGLILMSLELG
jgi:hypothetical protein